MEQEREVPEEKKCEFCGGPYFGTVEGIDFCINCYLDHWRD